MHHLQFPGPAPLISPAAGLLFCSSLNEHHPRLISGPKRYPWKIISCLKRYTWKIISGPKYKVPGKFNHPPTFQVGLDFSDSAYFWLVVAVITSGAYCLHCRFPTNIYKRLRTYLELIGSLLKSFQGLFEADSSEPFSIFNNVFKPRACLCLSMYAKALQSLYMSVLSSNYQDR